MDGWTKRHVRMEVCNDKRIGEYGTAGLRNEAKLSGSCPFRPSVCPSVKHSLIFSERHKVLCDTFCVWQMWPRQQRKRLFCSVWTSTESSHFSIWATRKSCSSVKEYIYQQDTQTIPLLSGLCTAVRKLLIGWYVPPVLIFIVVNKWCCHSITISFALP